jgi:membrane-bound lytic murein transglycosylase A
MARRRSRSRARIPVALLLLAMVAIGGIWLWYFVRSPPPSAQTGPALTSVRFDDLPGWQTTDTRGALAAFRHSCPVLSRLSPTQTLGSRGYAGTAADWIAVCAVLPPAGSDAAATRDYFESRFAPVKIGSDTQGLFTGYYEPEVRVSSKRHGEYATPIYGLPPDLVTADLGLFHSDLAGQHITGRLEGDKLLPYPTRAQIDRDGPGAAPVLLYADDPVAVFFLHIPGSGRARLEDGSMLRLAYAGQNGRPYTPVGRTLIAEGVLDRAHMSMQAIAAWLHANPGEAPGVMESDASYVFFREMPVGDPTLGSPGSEGVPLTPEASLAVDTSVHPLGIPVFIATSAPDADPAKPERIFNRLFVAQDTGGAIKGIARADIFWGFGTAAEAIAGRMKSTGGFYVLLPKDAAARLAPHTELVEAAR